MSNPSRSEFVETVQRLVHERFPKVSVEPDAERFAIRIDGHWTSLENLYRISVRDPGRMELNIERWVVELLRAAKWTSDQPTSLDELRDRILPMLLADAPHDVGGAEVVSQSLLDGLEVAYAIDSENAIAYVPRSVFDAWGIGMDELHDIALGNLAARSETLKAQAAEDDAGRVNLILVQVLDGYDASRLLLPKLHERLREHLGSPFLAGVPNRDILICFRNDPGNVERLGQQIAKDYRTMPHQVSDRIFLVTVDGIAVYRPA